MDATERKDARNAARRAILVVGATAGMTREAINQVIADCGLGDGYAESTVEMTLNQVPDYRQHPELLWAHIERSIDVHHHNEMKAQLEAAGSILSAKR
jgi:hypothetical protein